MSGNVHSFNVGNSTQALVKQEDSVQLALNQLASVFYATDEGIVDFSKRNRTLHSLNLDSCLAKYVYDRINDIALADNALFWHCVNVGYYARRIACSVGYSLDVCKDAWVAGVLHDYGKLYVPRDILDKPGQLSPFEYEVIKSHPVIGYRILAEGNVLSERVLVAILEHHERINGLGYPTGKKSISDLGELLAVCDVFEALTAQRAYKSSMTNTRAISILLHNDFRKEYLNALDGVMAEDLVYYNNFSI